LSVRTRRSKLTIRLAIIGFRAGMAWAAEHSACVALACFGVVLAWGCIGSDEPSGPHPLADAGAGGSLGTPPFVGLAGASAGVAGGGAGAGAGGAAGQPMLTADAGGAANMAPDGSAGAAPEDAGADAGAELDAALEAGP